MSNEERGTTPPDHVAEARPMSPLAQRLVDEVSRGVRAAIREHKLLGYPIVVWENGQVRIVPPDEIQLETEDGEN
ncbi:MAG: hypothetical protein OEW88_02845 [Gammaproteobacteria bacterium]|nr:hypothetical protein [Gammaproteobacteria bacterium]